MVTLQRCEGCAASHCRMQMTGFSFLLLPLPLRRGRASRVSWVSQKRRALTPAHTPLAGEPGAMRAGVTYSPSASGAIGVVRSMVESLITGLNQEYRRDAELPSSQTDGHKQLRPNVGEVNIVAPHISRKHRHLQFTSSAERSITLCMFLPESLRRNCYSD